MANTSVKALVKSTLYWYKKPCQIWLDQWLKLIVKSFLKFVSQVQVSNIASSISLFPLKLSFENTILLRIC